MDLSGLAAICLCETPFEFRRSAMGQLAGLVSAPLLCTARIRGFQGVFRQVGFVSHSGVTFSRTPCPASGSSAHTSLSLQDFCGGQIPAQQVGSGPAGEGGMQGPVSWGRCPARARPRRGGDACPSRDACTAEVTARQLSGAGGTSPPWLCCLSRRSASLS